MAGLTTVALLEQALRITIPAHDPYAILMIELASNAVRDAADQPGWVIGTPGQNQTEAPQAARDVALMVAVRIFTNPRNLERRTAGPLSETFRDIGVYGVDLTDGEKERLEPHISDSRRGSNGLWVQPTGAKLVPQRVYLADESPGATSILYAEGADLIAFIPSPYPWEELP
jgi:hypothetical protein